MRAEGAGWGWMPVGGGRARPARRRAGAGRRRRVNVCRIPHAIHVRAAARSLACASPWRAFAHTRQRVCVCGAALQGAARPSRARLNVPSGWAPSSPAPSHRLSPATPGSSRAPSCQACTSCFGSCPPCARGCIGGRAAAASAGAAGCPLTRAPRCPSRAATPGTPPSACGRGKPAARSPCPTGTTSRCTARRAWAAVAAAA
jgi:hypothetical protein